MHHDRTIPPVLPPSWDWWEDSAADGCTNMATDAALLDTVQPGRGVWRWYRWSEPTVSFGRHERTVGQYHPDRLTAAGLSAVRRPTGGRALLHWRELTYSVVMPLDAHRRWRDGYHAVNTILLRAFTALGIPAQLSSGGPLLRPDGAACFTAPSEGEIMVAGRKLVGSAVWRVGHAYLQHGSILVHDDQHQLATLTVTPRPPLPPAAVLADLLPHDTTGHTVHQAVHRTLQDVGAVTPFTPSAAFAEAHALQRRQFTETAWLWRR